MHYVCMYVCVCVCMYVQMNFSNNTAINRESSIFINATKVTDIFRNKQFEHLSLLVRSSVVRAFAHGAMGCQIDPSWGGPIELFLILASAP